MSNLSKMNTHTIAIIFRRPIFFSDSWLAAYAGPLLHTEILPIQNEDPMKTMSFTSYMGQPFSASFRVKETYNNDKCVALAFDVTEQEYLQIISYAHDLCSHNINYNYSDLLLTALPHTIQNAMIEDIPSEDPAHIKSLFCSQAVILILRNGLQENHPVMQAVGNLNSRTILPYKLYHLLKPYTKSVDCNALSQGLIQDLHSPIIL